MKRFCAEVLIVEYDILLLSLWVSAGVGVEGSSRCFELESRSFNRSIPATVLATKTPPGTLKGTYTTLTNPS